MQPANQGFKSRGGALAGNVMTEEQSAAEFKMRNVAMTAQEKLIYKERRRKVREARLRRLD